MKRFLFSFLLVALIYALVPDLFPQRLSMGVRAELTVTKAKSSGLSDVVSVRIEKKGHPRINLKVGRDLLSGITESFEKSSFLSPQEEPLALASDDFDEDGIPDLVCAYSSNESGILTIHSGNPDAIYPNSSAAKLRKAAGEFTDAPFLSQTYTKEIEESPDFLGTGDFDADGHRDIVTARRGSNRLHLLRGTGKGSFSTTSDLVVDGAITALMCGDVNRADGLSDLIAGINTQQGAKAFIFESPKGAMFATPEQIALPAMAVSFAAGELDGEYPVDLAIACENQLLCVHGRDRKLSLDPPQQALVKAPKITVASFPTLLKSVVVGDFIGGRESEPAVLGADGRLFALHARWKLNNQRQVTFSGWRSQELAATPRSEATQLFSAPMSSQSGDSLILIDKEKRQVRLVESNKLASDEKRTAALDTAATVELQMDSEPVAVLPMRLNEDALSDLVIFRKGALAPAIVPTATAMTFVVSNLFDSGAGSFRQAIMNANANPGADTITFDIGGGGIQTIPVVMGLPFISETVTINATTQGGYTGRPIIVLDGLGMPLPGLDIRASNCTVRGLVISHNSADGITITNASGCIIENNFIGTTVTGMADFANEGAGVHVINSNANRIGGTTPSALNLISSNSEGITIEGTNSSGNLIQGNFIGTDVNGTTNLGNVFHGVQIVGSPTNNNNLIGGTVTTARNIISGTSTGPGVRIVDGVTGTIVQNNFIGTSVNGNAAIGNGGEGIVIGAATNNLIGGSTASARNLISGNLGSGIEVTANADSNQFLGNFIGTDSSGLTSLSNSSHGIRVISASSNNQIGSTVAGNVIAFNFGNGILVITGSGNRIQSNSIFNHGLLGINLSDDLVTPNDAGDVDTGPNDLQNFPLLTSAVRSGSNTNIQGTLQSSPSSTFRIEFFSSLACNMLGNGEGQTFIGSTNVVTDAAGNANINVLLPVIVPDMQSVTSTATDALGNTSEFSACVTMVTPPCQIICPSNQVVVSSATQCGAVVTYPPISVIGACGQLTCTPPSGSFLSIGATTVNCTAGVGVNCSFTVTVFDSTPPAITCPASITVNAQTGQQAVVVNYTTPTATDNCVVANVTCQPPTGAAFPIGSTNVLCIAKDETGNEGSCQFLINVRDQEAPVIRCPANLTVDALLGQASVVVNYPAPTVTDNLPGATVTCTPASGSVFSLGVTTVNCTARDTAGNQSTCSFSITVRGGTPMAKVEIPNGRDSVPFGLTAPLNPVRKNPKKKGECGFFKIRNEGFTPLVLTLDSIVRTGSTVDSGRIKDANDSDFYELSIINANLSEVVITRGETVTIPIGSELNFCLRFTPFIPQVISNLNTLAAKDVLSNQLSSRVTFRLAGGAPVLINVAANVSTSLLLINATNPRKQAVVTYERRGNEFIFIYSVFDANLDVRKTTYEFLDNSGNRFGQPIEVDLTQALSQAGIIRGQSFTIEQRFTGAATNPEVSGGRITVSDSETSVTRVAENVSTSGVSTASVMTMKRATIKPSVTRVERLRP
jgi:parallel beta-helix repeat protein